MTDLTGSMYAHVCMHNRVRPIPWGPSVPRGLPCRTPAVMGPAETPYRIVQCVLGGGTTASGFQFRGFNRSIELILGI